jgi:acyl-CoA oxidase
MQRISLIKNHLNSSSKISKSQQKQTNKTPKYISSSYDYLNFDDFLNEDEIKYRKRVRVFMEKIRPRLMEFYQKQEFPKEIMNEFFTEFPGLIAMGIKGYGSAEISFWLGMAVLLEIARVDISFFTFFMIHGGKLNMNVIYLFGSEKQKEFYLPKMIKGEIISSFCLTEPEYGSDATSIKTFVEEIDSNSEVLILNGKKRWVGNASLAGLLIVWVKNAKTKNIEGYLVDAKTPGVTIKNIQGKLSLRMVYNCDIEFNNVRIKKSDKLPLAKNFQESVTGSLLFSRLGVSLGAVGASLGIYDEAIKYCTERIQFGKRISSFQLTQTKLAKIMANTQAMLFYCKRMGEIYLKGKVTAGNIGMLKAWCTEKARENAMLGRELLGGNGILIENNIMKHMLDIETLHTYEGTYDINMLVAGKELTGINAIR